MVRKILSGFQIGADIAGIRVGVDLGLKTGGMMPHGFRTKWGNRPKYVKYGAVEHETSTSYKPRTLWNIKDSDATIIFAKDFNSAGTLLTINGCKHYNKPYFLVDINDGYGEFIFDVLDFFRENHVEVLNVAGNAGVNKESTKYIYETTRSLLKNYVSRYNETPHKFVMGPKLS